MFSYFVTACLTETCNAGVPYHKVSIPIILVSFNKSVLSCISQNDACKTEENTCTFVTESSNIKVCQ